MRQRSCCPRFLRSRSWPSGARSSCPPILAAAGFVEAQTYLAPRIDYSFGPERYLEIVRRAKAAISIPVIASLNGVSGAGWVDYARGLQQAGADAIELNIYFPGRPSVARHPAPRSKGANVELVESVTRQVTLPVAVKVAPYFSAMANMAARLTRAGASGGWCSSTAFLQPEHRARGPRGPCRTWCYDLRRTAPGAALDRDPARPRRRQPGGHGRCAHPDDVLKLLLAGADCVMLASSLLTKGPTHVGPWCAASGPG